MGAGWSCPDAVCLVTARTPAPGSARPPTTTSGDSPAPTASGRRSPAPPHAAAAPNRPQAPAEPPRHPQRTRDRRSPGEHPCERRPGRRADSVRPPPSAPTSVRPQPTTMPEVTGQSGSLRNAPTVRAPGQAPSPKRVQYSPSRVAPEWRSFRRPATGNQQPATSNRIAHRRPPVAPVHRLAPPAPATV